MGDLRVANWTEFQHYKTGKNAGSPRWLKLYRDLLDSEDWFGLDDIQRYHVIGIWMLAARTEGIIKDNARWVAQRINASHPVDLDGLVKLGWLERVDEGPRTGVDECPRTGPDDGSRSVLGSSYENSASPASGENQTILGSSYEGPRNVLGQRREEKRREEESDARASAGAYPREGQPADPVIDELVKHGVPETHLGAVAEMMRSAERLATRTDGQCSSRHYASAIARRIGHAFEEALRLNEREARVLIAALTGPEPTVPGWWKPDRTGWVMTEVKEVRRSMEFGRGRYAELASQMGVDSQRTEAEDSFRPYRGPEGLDYSGADRLRKMLTVIEAAGEEGEDELAKEASR